MPLRRILIIAAITAGALAIASRVPTLRRLILNRARTPGPVTAGADATLSAEDAAFFAAEEAAGVITL